LNGRAILRRVGERDQGGRTALHYAALSNDVTEAKRRLASGDDPNGADHKGFTPLHFAAQEGSLEVARLLLDHGAAVDPPNQFGNTPLFTAVFNSRGEGALIELLTANGADPAHANEAGQTPVGLARLIDNYDVDQFFTDVPS
jgi:ankyrin repeat protein